MRAFVSLSALLTLLSLPGALTVALSSNGHWQKGLVFGLAVGLAFWLLFGFGLERLARRLGGGARRAGSGPLATLERSVLSRARTGRKPKLWVSAEPHPCAWVVRSWGSAGSIVISQGVLEQLEEFELRAVLKVLAERAGRLETVLQSYGAVLAALVLSLAPSAWVPLLFSSGGGAAMRRERGVVDRGQTPASLLAFVALYPWIAIFHHLGSGCRRTAAASTSDAFEFQQAVRKLTPSLDRIRPGLHPLCVSDSAKDRPSGVLFLR